MTALELDALYFSPGKWHGANDGEKLSGPHPPSVIRAVIKGGSDYRERDHVYLKAKCHQKLETWTTELLYVHSCCRQVLWNGSEINRFSFLPDGLFHNTVICITCGQCFTWQFFQTILILKLNIKHCFRKTGWSWAWDHLQGNCLYPQSHDFVSREISRPHVPGHHSISYHDIFKYRASEFLVHRHLSCVNLLDFWFRKLLR